MLLVGIGIGIILGLFYCGFVIKTLNNNFGFIIKTLNNNFVKFVLDYYKGK